MNIFLLLVILTTQTSSSALKRIVETSNHHRGYYHFEDNYSMLSANVTIGYSFEITISFYHQNKTTITNLQWYRNTIKLGNCKTRALSSRDRMYVYPYSSATKTTTIRLYKSHKRILLMSDNGIVFSANDSSACSAVVNPKANLISVSSSFGYFEITSVECKAGYHVNSSTFRCTKCPANTYSSNMECENCPPASKSPEGSKSFSACALESCKAGYFLDANLNCTICPNGTYSFKGQVACIPCPPGRTSRQGSSTRRQCKVCPRGYAVNNVTRLCDPCPNGTYTDTSRGVRCHPCPLGQTSKKASTSHTQCYFKCQPGEINSGDVCLKCPGNTYSGGRGETKCHRCPKNTEAPAGSSRKSNCKKVQPNNITPVKNSSHFNITSPIKGFFY